MSVYPQKKLTHSLSRKLYLQDLLSHSVAVLHNNQYNKSVKLFEKKIQSQKELATKHRH